MPVRRRKRKLSPALRKRRIERARMRRLRQAWRARRVKRAKLRRGRRLLTVAALAKRYGVTPSAIRKWRKTTETRPALPAVKIAGEVFLDPKVVARWYQRYVLSKYPHLLKLLTQKRA